MREIDTIMKMIIHLSMEVEREIHSDWKNILKGSMVKSFDKII